MIIFRKKEVKTMITSEMRVMTYIMTHNRQEIKTYISTLKEKALAKALELIKKYEILL